MSWLLISCWLNCTPIYVIMKVFSLTCSLLDLFFICKQSWRKNNQTRTRQLSEVCCSVLSGFRPTTPWGSEGSQDACQADKTAICVGCWEQVCEGLSWLSRLPGSGWVSLWEQKRAERESEQSAQSESGWDLPYTHRRGFLTDRISNLLPATAKLGIRF